ncbi:MAG: AMP-binding protein [Hydrogenophaga sp.]|uniref:AMP-binding protein n=1 Tax=Hydrogenophaga sp. TaxID=1904254 RepID=UPI00262FDBD6|nr:AMP-binding protein [Hydrogenophaga sp.]MCW5669662.1 AMP-binding protein [Hydrogenophaga sp.]
MTSALPTLIDLLAHNALAHGERPALIDEGAPHSHAVLYEAVQRQAAALSALGVGPGARVVLVAGNRAEVLVMLGAVAWLGAMLVPLNLRLSAGEMAQQSRDAAPALAVVDAACAPLWQAAWPEGMPGVSAVALGAATGPSLACAGPGSAPAVARQDAPELGAVMLFTAAVEGHARGAVLAQSQLTASARQIGEVWSLGVDDRWLGVLPLFHAAGIGLSLALLAAGGACVLLPRFDPAAAVAAVDRHQVSVCATFAPMLGALLDAAQASGASLASLRIGMGLEPPATLARLATLCPRVGFWSAYGQAEVSSMVCLGLQSERPGAAGRAVPPSQIRIQDAAGQPLANGVEGEIAVRGPTVFLGYWDVGTKRPFKPADPWHRTGDLGRIDEDGWLWFTGRAAHKQLIKSGGENVYPAEVEQVLLEHPAVAEAFVFGQPDEKWGEAVHAACALRPGAQATQAELIAFVAQRLARYKRPHSVSLRPAPLQRSVQA